VLLENDAAAVMPSIGALVPGHVLVCPKEHVRSFASAPADSEAEFADLTTHSIRILEKRLGKPVHAFEHGSSLNDDRVACSVEHAHLHLLPADVSVEAAIRHAGPWTAVGESLGELRGVAGQAEYLLYRKPEGQRYVSIAPADGFRSQLMRQVFAEALGVSDRWNWRDYPQRSNIRATVELFSPSVREPALDPITH
jgi:diadenosine tetraphosphate (Ap4A) HIT family hydrolase